MTVGFLPLSPIKLLQLYNKCIWFKGRLSRISCPKPGMSQNSWRLVKNLSWIKCLQVLTRVGVERLDGGVWRGSRTALFSAAPAWNELFCSHLETQTWSLQSQGACCCLPGGTQGSLGVCGEVARKKARFSQSLKFWGVKLSEWLHSCTEGGRFLSGFLGNCFCIGRVADYQGFWKRTSCVLHRYGLPLSGGDTDLLLQPGFKLLEKDVTVCILRFRDECVKFGALTGLAANWPESHWHCGRQRTKTT